MKSTGPGKASKKTPSKKTPSKKTPAKKTPAKKTPAKKAAAKKTPAKKAAAKKTPAKKAAAKKAPVRGKSPSAKRASSARTSKRTSKPTATRARRGTLVVVESPAKARTIAKYLGAGYQVKASVGHVRDLPKSRIGVDVNAGFEPEYVVIEDKERVVSDIRNAAAGAEIVFLASDPDREGEAIAWHIAEEIRDVSKKIQRVRFNEITKRGITAALQKPLSIDLDRTDAQQARRILDRLVGYEISPVLWQKVARGLSAGRVQSVAVRLLVEREKEIAAFVPEEYWSLDCDLEAADPPRFRGKIWRWDGVKAAPKTEAEAAEIATELKAGAANVSKVEKKERKRRPQPPFITSKLQQEAARRLGLSAKRTMTLAQKLYEGMDVGGRGRTGLITYMRTDSTRVSPDALSAVRDHIRSEYGAAYVPNRANSYSKSAKAQDAHEAIRPTSMEHTPAVVAAGLANHADRAQLIKLYQLIWNRFVASQMTPAVYDQTTIDITRGRAILRANGQILKFPGFTAVYTARETDDRKADNLASSDKPLPPVELGDPIKILKVDPKQHFTQPPPRYSEATLVKELEDRGIGRPSTYAAILATIVSRGYAVRKEKRFWPTELGTTVTELLIESFPRILDIDFTAQMETNLDDVEAGKRGWRDLLAAFYKPFHQNVVRARRSMRSVKTEGASTEHVCEKCASPMVVRDGKNGRFLACTAFPSCRNTKEVRKSEGGALEVVAAKTTDEVCHKCSAPMTVKSGRFGEFLSCSKYPECRATRPMSSGIECPRDGCGGFLAEKRRGTGAVFYGCSRYATSGCEFSTTSKPVAEPCPSCGAKFLLEKAGASGQSIHCPEKACDYSRDR